MSDNPFASRNAVPATPETPKEKVHSATGRTQSRALPSISLPLPDGSRQLISYIYVQPRISDTVIFLQFDAHAIAYFGRNLMKIEGHLNSHHVERLHVFDPATDALPEDGEAVIEDVKTTMPDLQSLVKAMLERKPPAS